MFLSVFSPCTTASLCLVSHLSLQHIMSCCRYTLTHSVYSWYGWEEVTTDGCWSSVQTILVNWAQHVFDLPLNTKSSSLELPRTFVTHPNNTLQEMIWEEMMHVGFSSVLDSVVAMLERCMRQEVLAILMNSRHPLHVSFAAQKSNRSNRLLSQERALEETVYPHWNQIFRSVWTIWLELYVFCCAAL